MQSTAGGDEDADPRVYRTSSSDQKEECLQERTRQTLCPTGIFFHLRCFPLDSLTLSVILIVA